jgi:hypothetical protein
LFSIDKVSKVTSPVLVIHGTEDEVIDFSHGMTIYEKCPRAVEPLWVEGAGHNDVEMFSQYLERLKNFVSVELVNWQKENRRRKKDGDKDNANDDNDDEDDDVNTGKLKGKQICRRINKLSNLIPRWWHSKCLHHSDINPIKIIKGWFNNRKITLAQRFSHLHKWHNHRSFYHQPKQHLRLFGN